MPYAWNFKAESMLSHHFVDYSSFMAIMQSFRFKSFSVKAIRDGMLIQLANIPFIYYFGPEKRFPDGKMFIDLSHSVTSRLLNNISKALDYSDRQTEKARQTTDGEKDRNFSNFEDAKVAFYNGVNALIDLIGPCTVDQAYIVGIYIRATFEAETGLKWDGQELQLPDEVRESVDEP